MFSLIAASMIRVFATKTDYHYFGKCYEKSISFRNNRRILTYISNNSVRYTNPKHSLRDKSLYLMLQNKELGL